MRTHIVIGCFVALFGTSCAMAQSRTLTFDDVPSGTTLYYSPLYMDTYRVRFDSCFKAVDHTGADWGIPSSTPNVAACASYRDGYDPRVIFGYATPLYSDFDDVLSVQAHFSTMMGAVVSVTAYEWIETTWGGYGQPIGTTVIGTPGLSTDKVAVEIHYDGVPLCMLKFHGINSAADLLGFCIDDMTITYVPEPSSLLALCAGIAAMGALIRGRQR